MIGVYDGVGDCSEGHVYLKDTGEERGYVASATRHLGITALPGDLGISWVLRTKEPGELGPWAHRGMAWCPSPSEVAVTGGHARSERCLCAGLAGAATLCRSDVMSVPQREFYLQTEGQETRGGARNIFSCI